MARPKVYDERVATGLRLRPETLERLSASALAAGLSKNALLEQLVEAHLARQEQRQPLDWKV